MTETKKAKFQASPLSRYGEAGPPVQHSDTITMTELKELIEREKIKPEQLYTKEQILADPKVKAKIDDLILKEIEAEKLKEDEMIPTDDIPKLTPEQKKQQEKDNEFVADGKGEPGEDSMIPD